MHELGSYLTILVVKNTGAVVYILKAQAEQLQKISRRFACMAMVIGLLSLVTACTAQLARVMPQADGNYTVIANASNSANAERGALKRAQQVCTKQNKLITVNNLETQYQGAGKDINIRNTHDPNNYVTTVNFTCN